MNLKSIMPAFLALTALSAACASEVRVIDAAYLDALRSEVQTNHPSVAAAKERMLAAEAGIRAVRRWEDPEAGVGFMAAEREMRAEDGDLMFGVDQMLPRRKLFGALKAK